MCSEKPSVRETEREREIYRPVQGEPGWIHSGSSLGRWARCNTRHTLLCTVDFLQQRRDQTEQCALTWKS